MILLRKKAQDLLDSFELNDLHATLIDKTVALANSCGQPIVTIYGITFSKKSINEKERTYAVELLKQFLIVHGDKIKKYLTDKKIFSNLPELIKPKNWSISTTIRRQGPVLTFIYDTEETYFSCVIDDDNVKHPKIYNNGRLQTYTITQLQDILNSINNSLPEVQKYIKEYLTRQQIERDINKQLSEIGKCNI